MSKRNDSDASWEWDWRSNMWLVTYPDGYSEWRPYTANVQIVEPAAMEPAPSTPKAPEGDTGDGDGAGVMRGAGTGTGGGMPWGLLLVLGALAVIVALDD